jgi:hypothetical protein
MDDMQTGEPNDVKPETADLMDRLDDADPAEAPPVAEQIADRLSEELDAAGGDARSDAEPGD